jgi:aspartyl protease family protein
VIGWALRWVLSCCVIVLLCVGILNRSAELSLSLPSVQKPSNAPPNTLVYPADGRGHVFLDGAVNGAPVRFLVDTGASLVTLTHEDARAAGIARGQLVFDKPVNTANGTARMARVTLREVRLDQFSIYDVPAAVLENLNVSLLGMSFLSRLQSYEMRDGKLTINW